MASTSFLWRFFAIYLYASLSLASKDSHIKYSTVTGYFLQDLNSTDPSSFNYTATNFGLINQSYTGQSDCSSHGSSLTQWQKFAREIFRLNQEGGKNVEYKLLFLGRHGEGWHNAAESFYGTPAWNCYWAEINGNTTASWEDAHLTSNGISQAKIAHDFWANEISNQKIPTPDAFYVSPLSRCLATVNITFSGLELPGKKPFVPIVKEYLREGISIHTCDHRSNKTYIQDTYPHFKIEEGFSEYDKLWNGVTAETSVAQALRSKAMLDDIFRANRGSYISITSHSGEISSILSVLGHRNFGLSTGAVIPVLVKAETVSGSVTTTAASWSASPHCTSPPITSISNGACVCQSSAAPVTTPLVIESPTVAPIQTFLPSAKARAKSWQPQAEES